MVWPAREITQLGYVCRNLEDAIGWFVSHQGAGPFYMMEVPPGAADYTFHGKTVTNVTKNRVAFGYRGRNQYELIETDNPIFDHARRGKELAYHHCMQMSDTFEKDRAHYEEAGFATMGTAAMPGVLIHYIDTLDTLGHYTELFDYGAAMRENSGAMFKMFEEMHREALSWDGKDPIRALDELAMRVLAPRADAANPAIVGDQ